MLLLQHDVVDTKQCRFELIVYQFVTLAAAVREYIEVA